MFPSVTSVTIRTVNEEFPDFRKGDMADQAAQENRRQTHLLVMAAISALGNSEGDQMTGPHPSEPRSHRTVVFGLPGGNLHSQIARFPSRNSLQVMQREARGR